MIKVVTALHMRAIDARTIGEMKIPGAVLMENAGAAVAAAVVERFPNPAGLKVSVFLGKGNNGGDGFVAARRLMNMGADVTAFLLARKEEVKGDAAGNLAAFEAMGGAVKEITEARHLGNFKLKFMHSAVMVDALLGTGLSQAPHGLIAEMIGVINQSPGYKVAVDLPSGMYSDGGIIPGVCVRADVTVTFGLPKVGLVTFPARRLAGHLIIADISIPARVTDESPCAAFVMEWEDAMALLPSRSPEAHKGSFGHLAMACGSVGMGGTAALAGLAALRMGVGLVTAAAPQPLCAAYETAVPEMMTLPLPHTAGGAISSLAAEKFIAFARDKTAALMGPGLRTDESTARFVHQVCRELDIPLLIDADGLNNIGLDISAIKNRKAPTVITPHPGEMARLTGKSVEEIQADRLGAAADYARETGAVVVLKGAGTVIAAPGQAPRINLTGNHGLATGGSGDVLAGMIAGLMAQGVAPLDAASAGVWLHGRCADIYAMDADARTLIPTDIIGLIPKAIAEATRPDKSQKRRV
jgi:NAD(P)H-hydrate epimerase